MGNEGSIEGGEGLGGYPEGDGRGGFAQIPAGMEADLSRLSEEERKQIAAVMSRAQEQPTDRPAIRHVTPLIPLYVLCIVTAARVDPHYTFPRHNMSEEPHTDLLLFLPLLEGRDKLFV